MNKPNPQSADHADKLVQVLKTWLAEREDKAIVVWLVADRLHDWAHSKTQSE